MTKSQFWMGKLSINGHVQQISGKLPERKSYACALRVEYILINYPVCVPIDWESVLENKVPHSIASFNTSFSSLTCSFLGHPPFSYKPMRRELLSYQGSCQEAGSSEMYVINVNHSWTWTVTTNSSSWSRRFLCFGTSTEINKFGEQ